MVIWSIDSIVRIFCFFHQTINRSINLSIIFIQKYSILFANFFQIVANICMRIFWVNADLRRRKHKIGFLRCDKTLNMLNKSQITPKISLLKTIKSAFLVKNNYEKKMCRVICFNLISNPHEETNKQSPRLMNSNIYYCFIYSLILLM